LINQIETRKQLLKCKFVIPKLYAFLGDIKLDITNANYQIETTQHQETSPINTTQTFSIQGIKLSAVLPDTSLERDSVLVTIIQRNSSKQTENPLLSIVINQTPLHTKLNGNCQHEIYFFNT
jgi:hypothetical protein